MKSRKELLTDLIECTKDLKTLSSDLSMIGWDGESNLVELTISRLKSLMHSYLRGDVDAEYVELWANLVESREDVFFTPQYSEIIANTIYILANPNLEGELNNQFISQLLGNLKT